MFPGLRKKDQDKKKSSESRTITIYPNSSGRETLLVPESGHHVINDNQETIIRADKEEMVVLLRTNIQISRNILLIAYIPSA